jgi:hypothetical protein
LTVAQKISPRLGGFPVPVGQCHEFFAPVGTYADHHQQAEFVLLQADVDMDAVRPEIHVVHIRQIVLAERTLLGLPLLGQLRDHRR